MGAQQMLTKQDVAEKLGCSVQTVHNLIRAGELEAIKVRKRMVRIHPEALAEYLQRRQPVTTQSVSDGVV